MQPKSAKSPLHVAVAVWLHDFCSATATLEGLEMLEGLEGLECSKRDFWSYSIFETVSGLS